jgi:hypothetical protein
VIADDGAVAFFFFQAALPSLYSLSDIIKKISFREKVAKGNVEIFTDLNTLISDYDVHVP